MTLKRLHANCKRNKEKIKLDNRSDRRLMKANLKHQCPTRRKLLSKLQLMLRDLERKERRRSRNR